MTPLLIILLAAHILFGLGLVLMHYSIWINLAKESPPIAYLKKISKISFVSALLAWLAGGYYYVVYYGTQVKPVIKAGKYAWAHSVFMEAKEHIFLLLPFLAIVLAVVIGKYGDELENSGQLKKQLTILAGISFWLGVFVTLAGPIISGAVR